MKRSVFLLAQLFFPGIFFSAFSQTPLSFRDTTISGPQTFAIVVGVSDYKFVRPLSFADKDAILFRDFLQSPGGGRVKDENIFTLLNEQASNANFWTKGFQWLKAKQLRKGDKLFIYLAGHGDAIDQDQFFFLGYDCNPAGDKNNYLVSGAIQLFNLKKKIANEAAKGVEVFFIMDACRTSELPGGTIGQRFLNTSVSEKQAGEIIMLATGAGQESLEDASIGNGHGLFTYYLVDGLSGLADSKERPDQKITFKEIQSYVDTNVPAVAKDRFKRSQDPFFCCNEYDDKIISNVDPAYLQKWLNLKKAQNSGGGNSFSGPALKRRTTGMADTLLLETYNRFNMAIRNKKITGTSSAEEYFKQLQAKFPGNPYTLDARSTLSVEYINFAQARVDQYLTCMTELTPADKEQNSEAANRLEKAITYVQEDDVDFANSLKGRLYLLKASGNNPSPETSLQSAYAAKAIDPGGAYILNELALLHFDNNNTDSALFYATKAAQIAPNWNCAVATLGKVKKKLNENKPNSTGDKKSINRFSKKLSMGFTLGGGINQSNPSYSGNANTGFVDVRSNTAPVFGAGIIAQISIGGNIFLRPAAGVSIENSDIDFVRRGATGQPDIIETVRFKGTAAHLSLPVIIRFSSRNIAPYFMAGPSFSYDISQNGATADLLVLKKSIFSGDAGIGVDIGLGNSGLSLSPELKYSAGFSDRKDPGSASPYAAALSGVKKNSFSFNLYLRKR